MIRSGTARPEDKSKAAYQNGPISDTKKPTYDVPLFVLA